MTENAPNAPAETVAGLSMDKEFMAAWTNPTHPGHTAAVARKSAAAANPVAPVDPYPAEALAAGLAADTAQGHGAATEATLESAYAPPASADEYKFTLPTPPDADPVRLLQDQKAARSIAFAVGAPDALAAEFVGLVTKAGDNMPSPEAIAHENERIEAKLRAELGDDGFEARLGAARALVARGGPALNDLLNRTGLGSSERIVRRVMNLAEARGLLPKS